MEAQLVSLCSPPTDIKKDKSKKKSPVSKLFRWGNKKEEWRLPPAAILLLLPSVPLLVSHALNLWCQSSAQVCVCVCVLACTVSSWRDRVLGHLVPWHSVSHSDQRLSRNDAHGGTVALLRWNSPEDFICPLRPLTHAHFLLAHTRTHKSCVFSLTPVSSSGCFTPCCQTPVNHCTAIITQWFYSSAPGTDEILCHVTQLVHIGPEFVKCLYVSNLLFLVLFFPFPTRVFENTRTWFTVVIFISLRILVSHVDFVHCMFVLLRKHSPAVCGIDWTCLEFQEMWNKSNQLFAKKKKCNTLHMWH